MSNILPKTPDNRTPIPEPDAGDAGLGIGGARREGRRKVNVVFFPQNTSIGGRKSAGHTPATDAGFAGASSSTRRWRMIASNEASTVVAGSPLL